LLERSFEAPGDQEPEIALVAGMALIQKTPRHWSSEEINLISPTQGRFDWILGAYYKNDHIDKNDRFIGEKLRSLTDVPCFRGRFAS
jgi:hypothetical protein